VTRRAFAVVSNPCARGPASELADAVVARIDAAGAGTHLLHTAPPDSAETVPGLAPLLHAPGVDLVFAVGGDGTVRAVAEAVARYGGTWPGGRDLTANGPAAPGIVIVPGGTGNSMYREVWADVPWEEMMAAVLEARSRVRAVDLYRIVESDTAVLLGASTGFFRWTLEATEQFPDLSGRELYAAAGAAVAETLEPYLGRVEVDGECVADGPIMLGVVGGAPRRSGTIHVLPGSEIDDGLLDVCVLTVATRGEFFDLMGKAVDGSHVGCSGAVFARGCNVALTSRDGELPFEHDGEILPVPGGKVTIEVVPHAVDIAAPL